MTLFIPNMLAPFGQGSVTINGRSYKFNTYLIPPWNSFFQQFTQAPPPMLGINIGASPFTYEAKEVGNVLISGGTLTDVALIRGNDTVSIGPVRLVPVGVRDLVRISYSVIPTTIKFVPTYGNRNT